MKGHDGALGIALFGDQHTQDPYSLYGRMHAEGSIDRIGDTDFYAVTGWDTVGEALKRCEDFSSHLAATTARGQYRASLADPNDERGLRIAGLSCGKRHDRHGTRGSIRVTPAGDAVPTVGSSRAPSESPTTRSTRSWGRSALTSSVRSIAG